MTEKKELQPLWGTPAERIVAIRQLPPGAGLIYHEGPDIYDCDTSLRELVRGMDTRGLAIAGRTATKRKKASQTGESIRVWEFWVIRRKEAKRASNVSAPMPSPRDLGLRSGRDSAKHSRST